MLKILPPPKLAVIFETMGYKRDEKNSQKVPPFFNLFFKSLYQRLGNNDFKGSFSTAICSDKTALEKCKAYESFAKGENLEVYSVKIPGYPFKNIFIDLFRSDHTAFISKKVPSIMITDTADFRNPNYHKPTDTLKTVDMDFIAKQSSAVIEMIEN